MDQTPDTTPDAAGTETVAVAAPAAGRRRPTGLPKLRVAMPKLRLPRPGRPAAADLMLAAGAASLVLSVLFVLTSPARERLQARGRAAAVVANAETLQLAAESWAAANLGRYPQDVRELVPYLPSGVAPRNPFTGDKALFRGAAGDLTYRRSAGGGYVIEAWGPGPAGPRRLATLTGKAPAEKP